MPELMPDLPEGQDLKLACFLLMRHFEELEPGLTVQEKPVLGQDLPVRPLFELVSGLEPPASGQKQPVPE